MSNPWNDISLSDYGSHMSSASVMQMQAINEMMKDQLESYPVKTAMILGIAGGNGIEHIDNEKYRKIYGVDVNEKYLIKAEKRYGDCGGILRYLHRDLLSEYANLPCVELVIANLIIEYIGYNTFKKIVMQVKPIYVSCVIQVNGESQEFISNSIYASAFLMLEKIHHEIKGELLEKAMLEIKYQLKNKRDLTLPNGKKLLKIDFIKNFVNETKNKRKVVFETMKTVVKKEDSVKKVFKGVSLDSLAVGKKSQVAKMNYVVGNYASPHKHPNEQSGYVISGRYKLTIGDDEYELNAGDSYSILADQVHSFKVIEAGEVIDVFTPPRQDYL